MASPAAVFLDYASVSAGDLDETELRRVLPELQLHAVTAPEQVVGRAAQAEVVLLNKVRLDAPTLAQLPRLRLVCAAATGTDNVDVETAGERGIAVCNIRAYCTGSVVQHVFALLLALTRHLASYQRLLREGAWRGSPQLRLLDYPIRELDGRTLGIVGHGELGRAVAAAAVAFGMRVELASRPGGPATPGRVPLDELLPRVDVLSLHCPLTPATRGLIGARQLAAMKPDALLINTARGGLVDAAALASALRAGRLGGAGIDVLEQEPPVDGSPLLASDVPNLIVTPHVAWAAREARQRALDQMTANVAAWLAGERRNRVV